MALGEPLPKQVFGHPWLLVGDGKMSKSLGNVIYADDLCACSALTQSATTCCMRCRSRTTACFSYELLCERINSDLANVLGNLVNRTIAMTKKYFGGIVPAPTAPEALDDELKAVALGLPAAVEKKMDTLHVADAIDEVFALLRRSNKYIDETMPWALAKDESKKSVSARSWYNLLEAIRFAAVELKPYLPDTADKIFAQLGIENKGVESLASFDGMQAGQPVGEASILFERIDIPEEAGRDRGGEEGSRGRAEAGCRVPAGHPFDDFCKVDMTVCKGPRLRERQEEQQAPQVPAG